MISDPKHGWSTFKLGDFEGTPSYLTDVPLDLLDAFLDYHYKGIGMAWFDEEGTEFTLVINPYSLFIIAERVEKNLNGWSEFLTTDDKEEMMQHRNDIRQRIAKLKKHIK